MSALRRSKKRLGTRKIKSLKSLARRIDAEESVSIRSRGRAVFARQQRLREILEILKGRRLAQGMSLAALARATGIAKPNLSRLERSRNSTPTLDTLDRYARAVGMAIEVELAPAHAA